MSLISRYIRVNIILHLFREELRQVYHSHSWNMKCLSFLCTKWMEICEAMTSSTHSFAYSYRLVKKCFLKICETSKYHNFLIFQPIFIRFSLFCSRIFTLSSEIKLNLVWISSLIHNSYIYPFIVPYLLVYQKHVFYQQVEQFPKVNSNQTIRCIARKKYIRRQKKALSYCSV